MYTRASERPEVILVYLRSYVGSSSAGGSGRGSYTGDFERWMKQALGTGRFSQKRLSAEGLWGGLPYWGPWKIC
jgi:hypothetical protein